MFEICHSILYSFNSIIFIIITILVIAIVTTIKRHNLKFKGKANIQLAEILDYIRDNKNVDKINKLKKLSQMNKNLINISFGSLKNTPFLVACENGATDIVIEMLKMGADLNYTNSEGNGPLYLAVYFLCKNRGIEDATLIRVLFYCGCDINLKNKKGYTPLHLAAYFGHVPLICWLLEKGADANIPPMSAGLALANGKNTAAYIIFKNQNKNDDSKLLKI